MRAMHAVGLRAVASASSSVAVRVTRAGVVARRGVCSGASAVRGSVRGAGTAPVARGRRTVLAPLLPRALGRTPLRRRLVHTCSRSGGAVAAPYQNDGGTSTGDLGLTDDQVEFFNENGYLVVPDFWTRDTCANLITRANEIVHDFEPATVSIFSTNEQTRTSDDHFLGSGDKVTCFFEEDAFDEDGQLKVDKDRAINKLGHALHDLEPLFKEATYTPRAAAICRSLGYELPRLVQSMYIFKQPYVGGEVGAHQDGTFLYTEPQSVTGFWWALEDCTLDNGCLWAVPGSHKLGVERWFRRAAGGGTEFVPEEAPELSKEGSVPLETKAGTLVLLHHALVHYSEANRSPHSRHAYSVHLVEGGKGVVYPEQNWLQRPNGPAFSTFDEFKA